MAEMRDEGFQLVLGEYPIEDVTQAFISYLKTGKEIPTPADIVAIVDPSTKPLCRIYYEKLLAEKWPLPDEKAYIEKYEQQQLERV